MVWSCGGNIPEGVVQAASAEWRVWKKFHRLGSTNPAWSFSGEGAMGLPGGWSAGTNTSRLLLWVLTLAVPMAERSRKV